MPAMTHADAADALFAAVAKYLSRNLDRPGIYEATDDLMERVAEAARAYRDLRFPELREEAARNQAAWAAAKVRT
jgi:hypothetical protein